MTAMLLLPIMAFTAVAVDLGAWYSRGEQLQRYADAAALAAAPLLPDEGDANTAAGEALTKNGVDCAVLSCSMGAISGSDTKYKVSVTDPRVEQFFSRPFENQVDITRSATAQRVRPVPMGSPRNFLGTNALFTGAARENLWLSVSGYCARNEHGDRITPRADANGSSGLGNCVPGFGGYVRENVDYSTDGYFYGVTFPPGATGSHRVEVYDAAQCQFEGTGANDSGADNATAARQYEFTVRDNDSNDPRLTTPLFTQIISPSNCGTYAGRWVNLGNISNPVGTYYVQVKPVIPTSKTVAEGQNQFGLRVYSGSWSPCTNDSTVSGGTVSLNPTCPNVFAVSHLGVYAAIAGVTPSFFLASVEAEHAGKIMEVELFDTAEGSLALELLDPNGNAVNFRWEIACKDGKYQSQTGTGCATGEAAPTGGYGNLISNRLDVSGTGTKPFTRLTQTGKYSDRLLRLQVTLPTDYATRYGANTWWRMRYTPAAAASSDRTTWSVSIKGDPVRLIPN